MLEGKKYCKYMPMRALAAIFTVIILAASILAPFTYIVNGNHFVLRFDVEDIEKEYPSYEIVLLKNLPYENNYYSIIFLSNI